MLKNIKFEINLSIIILIVMMISCRAQKKPSKIEKVKPISLLSTPNKLDSIYGWRVEGLKPALDEKIFSYKLANLTPLEIVRNDFLIKKGVLYDKEIRVTGNVDIIVQFTPQKRWLVKIEEGRITQSFSQENFKNWQYQIFSFYGDIEMSGFIDSSIYIKKFKDDGNGYWKDFYQLEFLGKGDLLIKEEGNIENNFKTGVWKYYDKKGKVIKIKKYKVKDSVDVRFPHCLFNKNEPCYK